ncbi:DNA/RNA non-specific endonuclease [Bradyrhizobium sp. CCBAU 21360]|uniref:DNA/RNA non-specific endonuclease n=1 Tax=Bradyrhizobium sp. CCBAU 21360 TaxID=1325081 RepID=UPI002305829E|nr:DNA/RNA non-specific endonuclease [Bradyrhizobium sp. CCBAU 21360]MDA9448236.1 DNA/RNA non-specific endonuclease [Bradyrhizobium sp. CCBAU 21360]
MEIDQTRFRNVVEQTREDRDRVRKLVESKQWRQAEPDRTRMAMFSLRTARQTMPRGAEAVQGPDDMQASWFLPGGATARRAIAFVEATAGGKWTAGSGFLISPTLFMTNQHVIQDEAAALSAQITFDREMGEDGSMRPTTVFRLAPDRFALFSQQEELDYAIVALGQKVAGDSDPRDFGLCVLSDRPDKHVIGMNMNIVQHPNGLPKMIAIRNNILQYRTERTLLYETDTDHGSSGAAVFNDAWELVALHHFGEPFLERKDENGNAIPTNVNEGVRISAIYRHLSDRLATLDGDHRDLLRAALELSKTALVQTGGKRLSPPHPSADAQESLVMGKEGVMASEAGGNEIKVTIPIEVSVRVGGSYATAAPVAAAPAPQKTLTRAAEKISVDQDYSNRDGYDPRFVHGVTFPLPTPVGKLAKQIAPLRAGEQNAEAGELKYEHFSIKMNKAKKMALFTATNIDGKSFLNVDRSTGEVTDGAEGETWYGDPRISASFFIDQTFYSGWSNLFDRGHLTRRMDPDWGSKEEAERANADTYHFTNCTPQHFRFNESTKFWQGAEQYVLENGAISEEAANRICVFQGPIFDDKVDLWADDIQIPSSFFKVIAWKGKNGVKSVGLVVDQRQLLSEQRKGGIPPKPPAFVDVSQWRVAITEIERRTGLDFGDQVRSADTFETKDQPVVGEARPAIPVKSESDLLPRNL